jgi:hypothetical protein
VPWWPNQCDKIFGAKSCPDLGMQHKKVAQKIFSKEIYGLKSCLK